MHKHIWYMRNCHALRYHLSLVEQYQHTLEIRKKNENCEVE